MKIDRNKIRIRPTAYFNSGKLGTELLDLRKALMLPRVLHINTSVNSSNNLIVNYQLVNTIGRYEIINLPNNEFNIIFPDEPPVVGGGSTNMGVIVNNITAVGTMGLGLLEYYDNLVYLNVVDMTTLQPNTTAGVYESFIKIELYDTAISISY